MSLIQLIFYDMVAAISISIFMINVIALWCLFKKAGKTGWTSLIPFYNNFVLFEIIGMNPWWIFVIYLLYFFQKCLFLYIPVFDNSFLFLVFLMVPFTLLSIIIIWYVLICTMINLGRSFHKDNSFMIGLIFLPGIFIPLLAFGNDTYMGKNPINDFIFPPKTKTSNIKYCLKCGRKITDNSMKFCTNCGNCLIQK